MSNATIQETRMPFHSRNIAVIIKGFMAKCDKSGFWVKTTSVFHPQNINENMYVILGYLRNAPSK